MPYRHENKRKCVWENKEVASNCEDCRRPSHKLTLVRRSTDYGLHWGSGRWVCEECIARSVYRYEISVNIDNIDSVWPNVRYVAIEMPEGGEEG